MSSGVFNIQLSRVSNELMVVQYSTPKGVHWAQKAMLSNVHKYCLVFSKEFCWNTHLYIAIVL